MAKEVLLTQSGYDALVQELEYLKTEKRAELAEKIKVARGFGDLSENSEYDEAKNEQGLVEQRILELEATVKNAKIVNKDTMDKNTVGVGVHVIVVDEDGFITLTEEGMEIANKMYERHSLLSDWLVFLGVSRETALEDACRIEHVISEESFERIRAHVTEMREHL